MESEKKRVRSLKNLAFEKHILSHLTYDEKVNLLLNSFSREEQWKLMTVLQKERERYDEEIRIKIIESLTRGMK